MDESRGSGTYTLLLSLLSLSFHSMYGIRCLSPLPHFVLGYHTNSQGRSFPVFFFFYFFFFKLGKKATTGLGTNDPGLWHFGLGHWGRE